MHWYRLLFAEIGFRKTNSALAVLAVATAATLFVAAPLLVDGHRRQTAAEVLRCQEQLGESERVAGEIRAGIERVEKSTAAEMAELEAKTRRVMRDIGFNLLIVHRDTNMSEFWDSDFTLVDMPQEYIDRLAKAKTLTLVTHLVASLQAKITFNGRKALLAGYLPETPQAHMAEKSPMGMKIAPGKVVLGHELASGHKPGDSVEVLGKRFEVAAIQPEQGSKDDITLAMHLSDSQQLLKKPGRITQILALGCKCEGSRLPKIRGQLAAVLPETKITEFKSIAVAREEQRALVEAKQKSLVDQMKANLAQREQLADEHRAILDDVRQRQGDLERLSAALANVATPLVVLAAAVWVGLLSLANVRQRRNEIGLLRALGKSFTTVAALLLGKAALLGTVGGAIGVAAGLALAYIPGGFSATGTSPAAFPLELVAAAILGAPLVAVAAGYLPTLSALSDDPAAVLRAE